MQAFTGVTGYSRGLAFHIIIRDFFKNITGPSQFRFYALSYEHRQIGYLSGIFQPYQKKFGLIVTAKVFKNMFPRGKSI